MTLNAHFTVVVGRLRFVLIWFAHLSAEKPEMAWHGQTGGVNEITTEEVVLRIVLTVAVRRVVAPNAVVPLRQGVPHALPRLRPHQHQPQRHPWHHHRIMPPHFNVLGTFCYWLDCDLKSFMNLTLQSGFKSHHASITAHAFILLFRRHITSHGYICAPKFTPISPPSSLPSALHFGTLCFSTFSSHVAHSLARSQFTHSASVVHCLHLRLSFDVPYGSVPISKSPSPPSLLRAPYAFSRVGGGAGAGGSDAFSWTRARARLAPTQRARVCLYAFQFSVSNHRTVHYVNRI